MSREKQIAEIGIELSNALHEHDIAWTNYIQDSKNHQKPMGEFRAMAEHLYNAGYRKQEWISVEDRLPEKDVRVLVYIKSDRSYTKFDTDRLDDRGFVRWYKDVTHWMPLPEAPKMKGGAE